MEQKKKLEELGALWIKISKKGTRFLDGTIDGKPVMIFSNQFKKPDSREPDYRVYKKEPREQKGNPNKSWNDTKTEAFFGNNAATESDVPF